MLTASIFEHASHRPDKPALIHDGQVWTYAVFADNIARARGYFVRNGVVGPAFASIAVEDQAMVWVLSLALRSLGVTTMNRGFDLADAGMVRWAVRRVGEDIPKLEAACLAGGVPLLAVSLEGETPLGLEEGPRVDRPGGQILHTSGTTGAFKKVLIDTDIEAGFVEARRRTGQLSEDSMFSAFRCPVWTGAGYKFPASVWSLGGTVVVDWSELHGPLLQPRLTHALMTPPMLRGLLAAPEDAYPRNEGLMLLVGGGTMSWAEVLEAKRRITPHVYNRLAATEVTAYGMTLLETPEDLRWHRISPEAEVQVVDDDDRPLPPGEMGTVRVGAAGGPNGYLDDTEASAAFFRHGYFYPGDLGVLREDGRLALQGRVTDVINIDGVKIAPGPIEDRIREAIGSSAVLLTMQNDAGEEELHVAIEAVTAPPTDALSKVLRAELAQARRAHVHVMAAFPRNAMGKVMRAQLTAQIVSALRAKGPAS